MQKRKSGVHSKPTKQDTVATSTIVTQKAKKRGKSGYKDFQDSISYYILLLCAIVAALAAQRLESWSAKITVIVVCCTIIGGTSYSTMQSLSNN